MNSIKVCEYSRSRSFHDDLILQDQASGERSQDQWSSGFFFMTGRLTLCFTLCKIVFCKIHIYLVCVYCGLTQSVMLRWSIGMNQYYYIQHHGKVSMALYHCTEKNL